MHNEELNRMQQHCCFPHGEVGAGKLEHQVFYLQNSNSKGWIPQGKIQLPSQGPAHILHLPGDANLVRSLCLFKARSFGDDDFPPTPACRIISAKAKKTDNTAIWLKWQSPNYIQDGWFVYIFCTLYVFSLDYLILNFRHVMLHLSRYIIRGHIKIQAESYKFHTIYTNQIIYIYSWNLKPEEEKKHLPRFLSSSWSSSSFHFLSLSEKLILRVLSYIRYYSKEWRAKKKKISNYMNQNAWTNLGLPGSCCPSTTRPFKLLSGGDGMSCAVWSFPIFDTRLPLLPGLPELRASATADGVPIGPRLGDLLLGGNFKYLEVVSSGELSKKFGEHTTFRLL